MESRVNGNKSTEYVISLAGGNVTGPFTFTSWISSISSSLLLVLIVPIARPQKNQFHFVSNKKFDFFYFRQKIKEDSHNISLYKFCLQLVSPEANTTFYLYIKILE